MRERFISEKRKRGSGTFLSFMRNTHHTGMVHKKRRSPCANGRVGSTQYFKPTELYPFTVSTSRLATSFTTPKPEQPIGDLKATVYGGLGGQYTDFKETYRVSSGLGKIIQ